MPDKKYGVKRAITEIATGFVIAIILASVIDFGVIDPSFIWLFHSLNILFAMAMMYVIPYWSASYVIGWLFGLWIMSHAGLVGVVEVFFYFIPLAALAIRFVKK